MQNIIEPHAIDSVHAQIERAFDHLPRQTIFAFVGEAPEGEPQIWQFGPCAHSVLRVLTDLRVSMYGSPFLHRELEPCEVFFEAAASLSSPEHGLTDGSRMHAANCLNQLGQIAGLRFAVAWHVPGDDVCQLRLRNYDLVDAFEDFANRIATTVRYQLGAM